AHLGPVLLVQRVRLGPPLLEEALELVLLIRAELEAGIDLLELGLHPGGHVRRLVGVDDRCRQCDGTDDPACSVPHGGPLAWRHPADTSASTLPVRATRRGRTAERISSGPSSAPE